MQLSLKMFKAYLIQLFYRTQMSKFLFLKYVSVSDGDSTNLEEMPNSL